MQLNNVDVYDEDESEEVLATGIVWTEGKQFLSEVYGIFKSTDDNDFRVIYKDCDDIWRHKMYIPREALRGFADAIIEAYMDSK